MNGHTHFIDDPHVVIQQKEDGKDVFCLKCACRLTLVPEWLLPGNNTKR